MRLSHDTLRQALISAITVKKLEKIGTSTGYEPVHPRYSSGAITN